jgi:hypothetical protein
VKGGRGWHPVVHTHLREALKTLSLSVVVVDLRR